MIDNNASAPGELIDERYQVIGVIGSGAMGTVVRCSDTSLRNSDVVLKFLKQDYVQDAKQFERFKNEALLMRELNHPNIVHVYDLRCTQGTTHYITMEFIEGSSLKMVMEDLPGSFLPFKDAIKILREIAYGMSYAHMKGIIHRDLKPDNVLVSTDGEVKLTDFGLGKTLVINEDITDLGEAVGTPHYMSPEQLRGIKLDKRCDIYSFGIMAYELVTGKKPYQETNYLKLAAKHINEPIPKIIKSEVPAWFNDFIAKCCAKEREQRFQSFQEIYEILNSFVSSGKANGLDLSKNVTKRVYWILSWYFEKWKLKRVVLSAGLIFLCLLFVIILGKGNPDIRTFYGPSVINFENYAKIQLSGFKRFAFGEATAALMQKDRDSLFKAVETGNTEAIQILMSASLSPSLRDQQGRTALSLAASIGNVTVIKKIAKSMTNEELNFVDYEGNSALMWSLKNNHISASKELIKLGSNPNLANNAKESPLLYALKISNLSLIQFLLKNGAIADAELTAMSQKNKNKQICDLFKKIGSK